MPCLDCTRWTVPSGARSTRPPSSPRTTGSLTGRRCRRRARVELRRLRHRAVVHAGRRQQEGRLHPRARPRRPPRTVCANAGSALRDRSGRLAHDEFAEELRCRGVLRSRSRSTRSAGLIRGQADRREWRCDHRRHGDVVETDHAQVPGTATPRRPRPATTPSAIWSLKAITAVEAVLTTRGTASAAASNVGAGSGPSPRPPIRPPGPLPDGRPAFHRGPRARRTPEEDEPR